MYPRPSQPDTSISPRFCQGLRNAKIAGSRRRETWIRSHSEESSPQVPPGHWREEVMLARFRAGAVPLALRRDLDLSPEGAGQAAAICRPRATKSCSSRERPTGWPTSCGAPETSAAFGSTHGSKTTTSRE